MHKGGIEGVAPVNSVASSVRALQDAADATVECTSSHCVRRAIQECQKGACILIQVNFVRTKIGLLKQITISMCPEVARKIKIA